MSQKLQKRAFRLFFAGAFLAVAFVACVASLVGYKVPTVPILVISTLLSLAFAWVVTRRAESVDDGINARQAEELAEESLQFFLRSNPVGWLVLLWQKAA